MPASLPRNHAASSASASVASHGTINGRPENSSAITGTPRARARSITAWARTRLLPGQPGIGATGGLTAHGRGFAQTQQDRIDAIAQVDRCGDAGPLRTVDCHARCVSKLGLRQALTQTREHADLDSGSAAAHHGPRISPGASAERSDDGEPSNASAQRQHVRVVLQQYDRARGDPARELPALRQRRGGFRLRAAPIRIIEQAESLFETQHAPD